MEELDVREPGFIIEDVFHAAFKSIEAHICRDVETDYLVLFDAKHEKFCVVLEVVRVRSDSEGETKG